MALFNKDSAKEKVKEFTGGFSLSQDFKNKLESNGLEVDYGPKIQILLKQDVNNGLPANQVEDRLNFYIKKAVLEKIENQNVENFNIKNEDVSIKQIKKELDNLNYQNQILVKQIEILKKQNDDILKRLNEK
ncbi:MAG: hypothetical protein PHC65_00255 [Methanobacteriaceae archaeon]|jgi:hypothetical protein|uniref:hypothetical protein n=1 Tax=unclassified Methanobrevibacter TaxID=2638681 RepID=UPI002A142B68|nr:hypothetical protein [Methanobacteriaceae archaeon]MDD3408687.1 hypothetical protein [Methanobacteriaceae archaeon]MDD4593577.1 hypothetical protein [Methanobacteriaceae archaeon]